MQINPENRRIAPSDQVLGTDEKRKKNVSAGSTSSGSQLQWDTLEKEHGGRTQRDRRCLCSCCNFYLLVSLCCKNKSNVHPLPKHNSDGVNTKPLISSNKNSKNQHFSEENNKHRVTKESGTTGVRSADKLSSESPHLVVNKETSFSNDGRQSTSSHGNSAHSVITSSVPKLPSISTKSTGPLQKSSGRPDKISSPHTNGDAAKHENSADDNIAKTNLELLELNIKSVEEQNSTTNGKRPYYRTNGINRYNHIPWNHYHDDHDAIFVVDA